MNYNYLPSNRLETQINTSSKRLFMFMNELPITANPKPISARQVFKLVEKYPSIHENEELFSTIDELLAEVYINCQYPDLIDYVIPTMTDYSVYAIGILIELASGRSELSKLISLVTDDSEVASQVKLLELVKTELDIVDESEKLKTVIHSDNRGSHTKFFVDEWARNLGFNEVVELFITTNNKGTLRGLHRQTGTTPQQKIIKVLTGTFNVRVIFPKVETQWDEIYSKNATNIIHLENGTVIAEYDGFKFEDDPILVPENALLGYVSLENDSKMLYTADNDFNADEDDGFHYTSFGINWNYDGELIVSQRDLDAQEFINY